MSKVQEKLNRVLEFTQDYIKDNGFPPSVREICSSVGIKSTATCHLYLKKLEEMLNAKLGNKVDIMMVNGGQPVYYYIISVE